MLLSSYHQLVVLLHYCVFVFLLIQRIHGHFSGTSDNICWLAPEVLAQDTGGYSFLSDIYRYCIIIIIIIFVQNLNLNMRIILALL